MNAGFLREKRKAAGFKTASAAARALGVEISTYINHENGGKRPSIDLLRLYSEAFRFSLDEYYLSQSHFVGNLKASLLPMSTRGQVGVIGRVAAGIWSEAPISPYEVPTAYLPSLSGEDRRQFALEVDGESMNRTVNRGDFVVVEPWADVGRDVRDGDMVVVQRERHGLYETSLKRARLENGTISFWPESTDPKYTTPIDTRTADGERISVIGLVVWVVRRP